MAWGKTDQQKQQDRELRDARLKEQQTSAAAAEYAASPSGQAAAAHKNGNRFFQLQLRVGEVANGHISMPKIGFQVAERAGAILGGIEAAGWRLEHTGFVFAQTGSSGVSMGAGSNTDTSGEVMGIYLFRRVDEDT